MILLPFAILATLPIALWRGFALAVLWGWFVQPTFGGPELGLTAAIGICFIISLVTTRADHDDVDPDKRLERFITVILYGILTPALSLGFGWFFHAIG